MPARRASGALATWRHGPGLLACAMLFRRGMKTVVMLAFLALGPALAQQFPAVPPGAASATAATFGQRAGFVVPGAPIEDQRTLLCGR